MKKRRDIPHGWWTLVIARWWNPLFWITLIGSIPVLIGISYYKDGKRGCKNYCRFVVNCLKEYDLR